VTLRERVLRPEPQRTGSDTHRLDIEGLRAFAVLVVILFHAKVPFIAGGYIGVDVFFVLSGFLITGLIVREMEWSGGLRLVRFYARRIRRLLPASLFALVGVVVIAYTMISPIRWRGISGDVIWSSLYLVNWRFAGQAVDYLASDNAPSPVLHFWSLAVEEQFYLVWPFLLLMVTFFARRRWQDVRRPLVGGLLAIAVPSFAWSVYLTITDPGSAYFVSTTRMWELAVGGGLAIVAPRFAHMPKIVAEVLTWVGLAGVLFAAVAFGPGTPFPGYAALLPVLATAAVVSAGVAHQDTIGGRLLSWRPFVIIGGMSYALYLWHWPVLVGADAMWGPLTVPAALGFVAVSVVFAWISFRYVEQPIRRTGAIITPPWRGLLFGLLLTSLGVAAGAFLLSVVPTSNPDSTYDPSVATVAGSGSDASSDLGPVTVQQTASFVTPDPVDPRDDISTVYGECHQSEKDSEPIFCEFGAVDASLVALVGDSHAAQWVPALKVMAESYGFRLRTYTKSGCMFASTAGVTFETEPANDSCAEWNQRLVEELTGESRPELVLTSTFARWRLLEESGERMAMADAQELLADGLVKRWSDVTTAGVPLVVIQDPPAPGFDVPECVVENRETLGECAFERAERMAVNTGMAEAADRLGVPIVDVIDRICASDVCPAVIDDYLVWRDTHHLTATFSEILAPVLGSRMEPWLPGQRATSE
jgi:peptidoglycan/LPS O-acetylase OafA/YrhL